MEWVSAKIRRHHLPTFSSKPDRNLGRASTWQAPHNGDTADTGVKWASSGFQTSLSEALPLQEEWPRMKLQVGMLHENHICARWLICICWPMPVPSAAVPFDSVLGRPTRSIQRFLNWASARRVSVLAEVADFNAKVSQSKQKVRRCKGNFGR